MKLLPDQLLGGIGMPQMDEEQTKQMEKELKRTESIIDSMTREERTDHRILNANRRRRIARGSGTNVAEVNKLVKQYTEMRQMMRQLTGSGLIGGSGLKGKMMRRMAGLPEMAGLAGMGGDGAELPSFPSLTAPAGPSRKKPKKKRKKKRH
jgi:signal recognition particle subunit SRP54